MLYTWNELTPHFIHGVPQGVIHIGAHMAEELTVYNDNGINRIIWIEANPDLIPPLCNKLYGKSGSSVFSFAAHEMDGLTIEFNISNNGESSSIYKFGTHASEYPYIHFVKTVQVNTQRVDTLMEKSGYDRLLFDFVNLDIQGAELLALRGMSDQLKHVKYVYTEINERPLYEGCALMPEVDSYLSSLGFSRVDTRITQHGWGDCLYIKS